MKNDNKLNISTFIVFLVVEFVFRTMIGLFVVLESTIIGNIVFLIAHLLVIIFVLKWYTKKINKADFHLQGIHLPVFFWMGMIAISEYMFYISYKSIGIFPDEKIMIPLFIDKSMFSLWSIILSFCAIFYSPIVEEILFRSLLQKQLLKKTPPWLAILLSAIIFSLCHFDFSKIPITLVAGILLGVIYYRTDKLILPVLYHSFYNLLCRITTFTVIPVTFKHLVIFNLLFVCIIVFSIKGFLNVTKKFHIRL